MKILITGANGQLGCEIKNIIASGQSEIGLVSEVIRNAELFAVDVEELDITKLDEVSSVLMKFMPDVVINCAAATDVDGCEINKELALKINAIGPRNLAIICEKIGAKIIQVSTDYVFSGTGKIALNEFDLPNPNSVYGKTKLLGESYVREFATKKYIVRTSWLYGYTGHNFVNTMLRLGNEKESINVVNDQRGNPTNANDLAYHILKLIETDEYGIYNCTGNGECTWFEFASEIMKIAKVKCIVNPCTSEEYNMLAQRPKYSALDNMMLRLTIGDEMRNWKEALKEFINKKLN